ncbi:endolytic transglycosylase MltG, partial [Patescibacteria group bacterium]|nr:endolytic transglycosylase MltG [Patescibacteria group bacterium]MBU1703476.1 endolytic transglycosylase MltG [Patescibacteria group bacterium]
VNTFDNYDKYFFLDREAMKTLPHPLEGYLFPDTYFIDPLNFYSENLIQLMLENFERKIGEDLKKEATRSISDIVTMASIVEKEVRTKKDIPIVAGILWKRLDNSWLLGADATILYLKDDRSIDYQDLKEDSPYNTRVKGGLPPGPISNPGLESLKAALNPQDSPYWYYLTTPDTGEVIYAKTNDEHNSNKARYLN